MTSASRIFFTLTLFLILFSFQLVTLFTLRNFLKRKKINFSKKLLFSIVIVFNVPYFIFLFLKLELSEIPYLIYDIYVIPFFIYQTGMLFTGLIISLYNLIKSPFLLLNFILKRFSFIKQILENRKNKKSVVKFDKSRRDFIAGTGIFIAGYAFIGSGVGIITKDKYEINYQDIFVNDLPDDLIGFTISLVSDIHCGPFMQEDMLNEYVFAINQLQSDIIFIPGDITNSREDEVYPFLKTFSGLKAKYGVYATLGNHDYFSNADFIADKISSETDIKMLRNNSDIIYVKNSPLLILGTEDIRASTEKISPEIKKYFDDTIEHAKQLSSTKNVDYEKTKKILLYHKPYFFDDITERSIDLTLSGHTHGGQVVFAKIGNSSLSFASAASKYVHGLYSKNNFSMYVSRGIGTVGLPIRLNCPPEITQIILKKK